MEYRQFVDDVSECLRFKVDKGYDVKVNRILKNNSVELDGIVFFKEGDNISPNIYLNGYFDRYQHGESLDSIANDIIELYKTSMDTTASEYKQVEFSLEGMKEKIIYRLVNYQKNQSMLKEIPHIRFLDLAITFHCLVKQDEEGIGTIRLTNEHCREWNLSIKEMLQIAEKNTASLFPMKFSTMEEVIAEILKKDFMSFYDGEEIQEMLGSAYEQQNRPHMYILTNTIGINGATVLVYKEALKQVALRYNTDFYVLPSSIHEVILVPFDETIEANSLREMVEEVNGTQVPEEEILSNRVYLYHRENNSIEVVSE